MVQIASKIDLKKMRQSADGACKLMKVLSNRNRLMLLCEISQGEKSRHFSAHLIAAVNNFAHTKTS